MRLSWIKIVVTSCLLLSLLCILPMALAGCSSANHAQTISPEVEQPPAGDSTLQPPVSGLVLPAPSTLKLPQEVFSDVFHLGADYEDSWPHERDNRTFDDQLRLAPWWSDAESAYEPAFAMYAFDVTGYDHEHTLNVCWSSQPAGNHAWIGMADFVQDAWRWYEPNAQDQVVFDEAACLNSGIACAVVLLTGMEGWYLDCIYMGSRWAPLITGVSPRQGLEGDTVTIGATLKGTAQAGKKASEFYNWEWDFGGGATPNTATAATPTIQLGDPGVYYCTAVASGLAGDCEHEFLLTVNPSTTTWEIEAVELAGPAGGATSLALTKTADEYARIGFHATDLEELYFAQFTGSAWLTRKVRSSVPENGFTSTGLALDDLDDPHLVFVTGDDLRRSTQRGGLWYTDWIATANLPGQHWYEGPSLAFDSGGQAHVAWHETLWDSDWASDAVLYSWYDGDAWRSATEVAESGGLMEIDTIEPFQPIKLYGDAPRLCYFDTEAPDTLAYASKDGTWSDAQVGTGMSAVDISLAPDPATGQPRIAYVDKIGIFPGELVYAYFDGSQWHSNTISGTAEVGPYLSLALDESGQPRIACYEEQHGALIYFAFDGGVWNPETVDNSGDTGRYCSLALGSDGRAHISYYDATSGFVKYAQMPSS